MWTGTVRKSRRCHYWLHHHCLHKLSVSYNLWFTSVIMWWLLTCSEENIIKVWFDVVLARAIGQANCFHDKGHGAKCSLSIYPFMAAFGIVQIILSQIPNFRKLSFLSIIAAVMSFSYASIGIGLAIATVASTFSFPIYCILLFFFQNSIYICRTVSNYLETLCKFYIKYTFMLIGYLVRIQDILSKFTFENNNVEIGYLVRIHQLSILLHTNYIRKFVWVENHFDLGLIIRFS